MVIFLQALILLCSSTLIWMTSFSDRPFIQKALYITIIVAFIRTFVLS